MKKMQLLAVISLLSMATSNLFAIARNCEYVRDHVAPRGFPPVPDRSLQWGFDRVELDVLASGAFQYKCVWELEKRSTHERVPFTAFHKHMIAGAPIGRALWEQKPDSTTVWCVDNIHLCRWDEV